MPGREHSSFIKPPEKWTDPLEELIFRLRQRNRERRVIRRQLGDKIKGKLKRNKK